MFGARQIAAGEGADSTRGADMGGKEKKRRRESDDSVGGKEAAAEGGGGERHGGAEGGSDEPGRAKGEPDLREVQQLYEDGVLTREEAEIEKQRLMKRWNVAVPDAASRSGESSERLSSAAAAGAGSIFAPDREGRRRNAPKRFCPPHWQKDDKAPRRPLLHEDSCFNCGDGGELLECSVCPKVYHIDEECAGLPGGKIPRGQWICPWHSCFECDRKSSQAGGMLYHCTECPTSYCFDHCPDEFKEPPSDAETRDHKFIKAGLESQGVANTQSWLFFTCTECAPAAEHRRQQRAEEDRAREQRLQQAKQEALAKEKERQRAREQAKAQHDAQLQLLAQQQAQAAQLNAQRFQASMHAGWTEVRGQDGRRYWQNNVTGGCTQVLPANPGGWSHPQHLPGNSSQQLSLGNPMPKPAASEDELLEAEGWKAYTGELALRM